MTALPRLAISVRQPWAWAICAGHKSVENRSKAALRRKTFRRGPVAIHAARGMTRDDYESAADFMLGLGVTCPPAADLPRGGIVGAADIVDLVTKMDDPWFFGPAGLVLANAVAITPIPAVGALGSFEWSPSGDSLVPPAKWMVPWGSSAAPAQLQSGGVP